MRPSVLPRERTTSTRCPRCKGPLFIDEGSDRFCLLCGERSYDLLGALWDRLLHAMERQAERDREREMRAEK